MVALPLYHRESRGALSQIVSRLLRGKMHPVVVVPAGEDAQNVDERAYQIAVMIYARYGTQINLRIGMCNGLVLDCARWRRAVERKLIPDSFQRLEATVYGIELLMESIDWQKGTAVTVIVASRPTVKRLLRNMKCRNSPLESWHPHFLWLRRSRRGSLSVSPEPS